MIKFSIFAQKSIYTLASFGHSIFANYLSTLQLIYKQKKNNKFLIDLFKSFFCEFINSKIIDHFGRRAMMVLKCSVTVWKKAKKKLVFSSKRNYFQLAAPATKKKVNKKEKRKITAAVIHWTIYFLLLENTTTYSEWETMNFRKRFTQYFYFYSCSPSFVSFSLFVLFWFFFRLNFAFNAFAGCFILFGNFYATQLCLKSVGVDSVLDLHILQSLDCFIL